MSRCWNPECERCDYDPMSIVHADDMMIGWVEHNGERYPIWAIEKYGVVCPLIGVSNGSAAVVVHRLLALMELCRSPHPITAEYRSFEFSPCLRDHVDDLEDELWRRYEEVVSAQH